MVEHLSGYQARDFEVIDYEMYQLGDTELWFRGPEPKSLRSGEYIVFLGAAQTFGCLCHEPFPKLIERKLRLGVLNLGYGGAGPEFFLKHKSLWSYINNSRLVVVQVMSGRSVSNSVFDSHGLEYLERRSDGKRLGATAAFAEILYDAERWQRSRLPQPAVRVLRYLWRPISRWRARDLVTQTRQNWIVKNQELIARIGVPKLLFWFSQRSPDYVERYRSVDDIFGRFPQLVNRSMIEAICAHADSYVECITERGLPQPLYSRFTGQAVAIDPAKDRPDLGGCLISKNQYYPSPEMHVDAAAALLPELIRMLGLTNHSIEA